jgi:hypothetical protein
MRAQTKLDTFALSSKPLINQCCGIAQTIGAVGWTIGAPTEETQNTLRTHRY